MKYFRIKKNLKKHKDSYIDIEKIEKIEGLKYGEKLFKDYIDQNNMSVNYDYIYAKGLH